MTRTVSPHVLTGDDRFAEVQRHPDGKPDERLVEVVSMKAAVKVSEAISRLRRQIDTTEFEEAVDDFLAAYGELRSQYYYEDSEAKANAKTASTLLEAVDRGLIELPQTDDGIVIVPDMKLRLPDGAKLYVNSIEIESTATGRAPIVRFEDGSSIRCRRGSGVQIVRMPLEEEQNAD